ncbi:hypothetical protein BGX26_008817 [Mortierella sp. AD094]|nr:hypothetical protein BGX26_008817 [Mortierella sp. AD094]
MELSPRDKDAFKVLSDSGFDQECIAYLKDLATAIYDNQDGNPTIEYSERRDQKTWKRTLFNNHDGKNLLREATPLIRNNDQYRFMHKSVLEYALTLAVFDPNVQNESNRTTSGSFRRGSTSSALSFEESTFIEKPAAAIEQPLLDSPLGRKSFVDELSISQFLVERAQQEPIFKEQLHAVIERSKTDKTARVAAANAITVLVRAGVQFVGSDLRDIKVPGSDLSYGMFDMAQLDGADLRKSNLYNIWLRKASLCGAQMTGVKFGELPLIQESAWAYCCAYSGDGQMLAVGLESGDIHLYDTSSRKRIRTLEGHTRGTRCLLFSEAGDLLASGGEDGQFRLWRLETGKCVYTFDCPTIVFAIFEYGPLGYEVACEDPYNAVEIWNVATGNCLHSFDDHRGAVRGVVFSPKGDRIASEGDDGKLRVWDTDTGDSVHILEGHEDVIFSIAFSPDGGQIASGSTDKTIRLWSAETGDCIHVLYGHDFQIFSLMYSPSGDQTASGSWDQTEIRLHQEARMKQHDFGMLKPGHDDEIIDIAYSPNGGQVASASLDNTVRLWDVETGKCVHTLQGHDNVLYSIMYSPNGDQIASGSGDNTVRLWDVESGNCVYTLMGHGKSVSKVAYSPKGHQIASGSSDTTLRLWIVETGSCVHVLRGHSSTVLVVTYLPSEAKIASGGRDNSVRLWDVETGESLVTITGFSGPVRSIVWQDTSDGRFLVTGSDDKSVRRWKIIQERDEYQVHLCWSSSNDGLVVADATFKDVEGLSQLNWVLLEQRGASLTSSSETLQ